MSKAGKGWSAEDHVLLQKLHAQGHSNATIAARLGRSRGAISSRLNHIADGTVPKTAEMRRMPTVLQTRRTVTVNSSAQVARLAPRKPPAVSLRPQSNARALLAHHSTSLTSLQSPSSLLSALHISTPPSSAPRDECPVHLREALKRYNSEHPGNRFEAREVRGNHRKPCTECEADFDGLDHYFSERGWSNDKLCVVCMEERLHPYMNERDTRPHAGGSYPTDGCEEWPMVERGQYGLVYIPHRDMFAYYDDDDVSELKRTLQRSSAQWTEDEDDEFEDSSYGEFMCILYRDGPMRGPCFEFPQYDVLKPPFDGDWVAL